MRNLRLLASLVVCSACANAYQSARLLPRGKTQVTVGMTRNEVTGNESDDDDDAFWLGDLQIRHGFDDYFEGGVRLHRTPGVAEAASVLQLDPKVSLTRPDASIAVSIGVPIGVGWTEENASDFGEGTYLVTPSLFVGFELSPSAELVISPKMFMIKPDGNDMEIELGGSLGVRIGDPSRTWAVHPELGILRIDDGAVTTVVTFGVGIAAGN